ncbi:MAG: nicotinate phosphoribosyltransferase [Candidatus Thermoplasmatota archaeon]
MSKFHNASYGEIKKGLTTDIYFKRTKDILKKKNIRKKVTAEYTYHSQNWEWVVFTGLEELLNLFEDIPVDIYALPEGTIFTSFSKNQVPIPVVVIKGYYDDFGIYETPSLGFICQASGIATKTARIRLKAKDKNMISFGVRRMHPSITPMIDRSAYIGGCNGVSSILGAKKIGKNPQGTMPHALLLTLGDKGGWKAYDEVMDPEVPRTTLIDTFDDEKFAALNSAEVMENIDAVRIDTPSSRKGDFIDLIREVRWELDIRGYENIKIFVSGGINEESMEKLVEEPIDGFGIGTSISSASTVDFAMDIVSVDGKPLAKRGKYSGEKQVYRKNNSLEYFVYPIEKNIEGNLQPMLKKYMEKGKIIKKTPDLDKMRQYVLKQLESIKDNSKR